MPSNRFNVEDVIPKDRVPFVPSTSIRNMQVIEVRLFVMTEYPHLQTTYAKWCKKCKEFHYLDIPCILN